ncbi:hypothetical protein [Amycolatopsis sp. NPDC059657]|uniref:hypothetical protein n=1 Tax=Amycolatopsis sp. NPDC059657 TaxID=3346899 RepID=UPI00366A8BB6
MRRFLTSVAIAGAVAAAAVTAPATASASTGSEEGAAAIAASQFDCGWLMCSYVFTRGTTKLIAEGGSAGKLCKVVPTPGNVACRIAWGSLVLTSKKAKSENKCTKITWTKTGPPAWTWYPSIDGGSRCK